MQSTLDLGDFFDLLLAQYSRIGLGLRRALQRLLREKLTVLTRGLFKLYLDDLTTNGDTCGR